MECLICHTVIDYYVKSLAGCRKCAYISNGLKMRKPFDYYKEEVEKYNFILLNIIRYTSIETSLELKCSQSHVFTKTLYEVQQGRSCPDCVTTHTLSESICRKYMEYLFNLPFKKKRFDWLVNNEGNQLELDGYNPELNIAFEYDGKQHFEFIFFFHRTEENFNKRQGDDKIKDKLCIDNNIKLIRIPYVVKYNDMLDFIKFKCKWLGIKYQDKENISTTDLDVYNKVIDDRNYVIDEKMKGSVWIRKSNAVSTQTKITFECNVCHQLKDMTYNNVIYNKVRVCKYCEHEEKLKELQETIKYRKWKVIGKYINCKQPIIIECDRCQYQRTCIPIDVISIKTIGKCPKC